MLEEMLRLYQRVNDLKEKVKLTQDELTETLYKVKEERGNSFEYNGKYYSIRKRKGGMYLCVADRPFGSWLKKEK